MIIKRIHIKDWRLIKEVDLALESNAAAIFGLNGQGKSSILSAIQFALFGTCSWTDARGAGRAALVRDGAKKADIKLTMDIGIGADVVVDVTVPRRGNVEWISLIHETGEVLHSDREEFWKVVGINRRHALVAAMPAAMVASRDLSDILAEFLGGDIRAEDVEHIIGDMLPWVQRFASDFKVGELNSVLAFQTLGQAAFNQRTELNRELRVAESEIDALGVTRAPVNAKGKAMGPEDIARVEGQVKQTEDQERDLLVEQGRLAERQEQDWGTMLAQAEDASFIASQKRAEEIAALQKTLTGAKRCLAALVDIAPREEALALAEQAVRDAQRDHNVATGEHAAALRAIEDCKRRIAAVNGKDGCCPTCRRPVDETVRAEILFPIECEIFAHQEKAEDASAAMKERLELIPATHEAVKAARTDLDGVRAAHTKAKAAVDRTTADIAATQRAHARAEDADKAKLAALRAKVEAQNPANDESPIENVAALEEVRSKLVRGRALLDDLRRMKEQIAAQRRHDVLKADIENLNWLVKSFKDGELLKELVKDELSSFVGRCNIELEPLGYRLDANVSGKDVELHLTCPGQASRLLRLCSKGNIAVAVWAVAMAFADTGAVVIFDDMNELDNVLRRRLLMRLRDVAMGTVIVAGAWQQSDTDMGRVARGLSPATIVWMDGGKAAVTVAEIAA